MITLDAASLRGSFPPLVTPFNDDGSVDYETYQRLVEFHVQGGSAGIVVTGTTGEPSTLAPEERIELLKVAVSTARRRIQVVAATGTQNHSETVAMTRAAEKHGVSYENATVYVADSPRDVDAAKIGGARSLAVASGRASAAELRDAGADAVLPDLSDTAALTALIVRLTEPANPSNHDIS